MFERERNGKSEVSSHWVELPVEVIRFFPLWLLHVELMNFHKFHYRRKNIFNSPQRGSNSRPFAYEANALPLCYGGSERLLTICPFHFR